MSSLLGEISLPTQLLLSFALGNAAEPALSPFVQSLSNEAWSTHAVKPPDAITLALGVAQGQVDPGQAASWAKETGFDKAQFDALVSIANVGPEVGLAYRAWRRNDLTDAQFQTALKRTGLEDQWVSALMALKDDPLEPSEIAKAVHRNIMAGSGLLLVEPSSTPGKVPMVPQSSLDPTTEAAWSGIDHERLRILVGNAGLPPGVVQGLELLNRGAITTDDFSRLVGESNMRQEWGDALLALRRRLLTPHEYEEAALRGVISQAEADTGAALSGMEKADAELLFEIMGRPVSVHQITTGLARGGSFGGTYADVPEPYQDAIRRSNIRPEYAKLAYANRYSYPSAFVLRALAQAGEIGDEAAIEKILEEIGWPPALATKVAAAWAGGTSASDPHVTKAENQLWTALHSSYVKDRTTDAEATTVLGELGVAGTAVPEVLRLWQAERSLVRAGLTAAQIKKAYSEATFTQPEAVARLVELGWSAADAGVYLSE